MAPRLRWKLPCIMYVCTRELYRNMYSCLCKHMCSPRNGAGKETRTGAKRKSCTRRRNETKRSFCECITRNPRTAAAVRQKNEQNRKRIVRRCWSWCCKIRHGLSGQTPGLHTHAHPAFCEKFDGGFFFCCFCFFVCSCGCGCALVVGISEYGGGREAASAAGHQEIEMGKKPSWSRLPVGFLAYFEIRGG
ncbi:hypothetical protein EDC01DRAFT_193458 [Geopyxis carbonaria]|nr:hypothetical protein EDC01DRAFT_193458 [Geopyxis carbonaria]